MSAEPELIGKGPFDLVPSHWRSGVLLTRTWQAPIVHGVTQIWADRCRGYWERIERRYGVVLTDHRNAYDDETGTISTVAAVLMIIDGERYPMPRSNEVH